MKKILRNWKTTVAGVVTIAGGIVHFILTKDAITSATTIAGGVGLIKAKDHDK